MDDGADCRRDLYLKTHNTQNRQTFMPQAVFETKIPASDGQQTLALDVSSTGIGITCKQLRLIIYVHSP